jgi:hypothetical protein
MGVPRYEIRVRGRVGDSILGALEGMSTAVESAETVFYGSVPDQAALHAMIVHIQSMGLDLTELRCLPGEDVEAGRPSPGPVRRDGRTGG